MTTKEQLEELLKDIPKTYNMVSAYSSVNVKDLEEAVDRFKYVPNYQDLLEENNKQQKEIERLNHECDTYLKIATKRKNIIDELEKWLSFEFYEMGLDVPIDEVLDKLKELKEGK